MVRGRAEDVSVEVRHAELGDAGRLADIWIASWQTAYRGVLHDSVLDEMSRAKRMATWMTRLLELDSGRRSDCRFFVAELPGDAVPDGHDDVVGLCETAPSPGNERRYGEIFTLYVDPPAWGRGAGRALLTQAAEDFRSRGFLAAVLWVLEENIAARQFYERCGLYPDGKRRRERLKGRPTSLRYMLALSETT